MVRRRLMSRRVITKDNIFINTDDFIQIGEYLIHPFGNYYIVGKPDSGIEVYSELDLALESIPDTVTV